MVGWLGWGKYMDAVGPSVGNGIASGKDASDIDSLRYLFSENEETDMNDASVRSRSAVRNKKKNAARDKAQVNFAPEQDAQIVVPEPVLTPVFSHNAVPDLNAAEIGVTDNRKTEETTDETNDAEAENDVDAIVSETSALSSQDISSAADLFFDNTAAPNLTEEAISERAQSSFAPPQSEEGQEQVSDAIDRAQDVIEQVAGTAMQKSQGGDKVSRSDLVNVLEGFVNLIKNTGDNSPANAHAPKQIAYDGAAQQKLTVQVDDKTAEVEELRCLLVEAQETIIRLLTDRVDDRARISQLEAELRLLPDLQAQADRALAVAMNTEDFRKELTRVKFEIERVRLAKVRAEVDKNHRSWLRGVRGWFFKTNENMRSRDPDIKIE